MLIRFSRTIRFAVILFKIGGLKVFIHQIRRQIYSQDVLIAMEKHLETKFSVLPSKIKYSLNLASPEDLEELLANIENEGSDSVHELVQRVWFYESGFRNCYVARADETGQICHLQWFIFPGENDIVRKGFNDRLPKISEGEVLVENVYTSKKYRRNGLMRAVTAEMCYLARKRGNKRIVVHVRKNNNNAMEAYTKIGFREFEIIHERKLLFHTRRIHGPVEPQLLPG